MASHAQTPLQPQATRIARISPRRNIHCKDEHEREWQALACKCGQKHSGCLTRRCSNITDHKRMLSLVKEAAAARDNAKLWAMRYNAFGTQAYLDHVDDLMLDLLVFLQNELDIAEGGWYGWHSKEKRQSKITEWLVTRDVGMEKNEKKRKRSADADADADSQATVPYDALDSASV